MMWVEMTALKEFLGQSIDGSSLAMFRVFFGFLLSVSTISNIKFTTGYFSKFDFYVKYRFFYWVKCPGLWAIRLAVFGLIISSACFALGLFYHLSILIAFFTYTYIFLLDKS
ncbi:MAG: HTTM domain-containing protein, partial [Chlamydiota bacterium]